VQLLRFQAVGRGQERGNVEGTVEAVDVPRLESQLPAELVDHGIVGGGGDLQPDRIAAVPRRTSRSMVHQEVFGFLLVDIQVQFRVTRQG